MDSLAFLFIFLLFVGIQSFQHDILVYKLFSKKQHTIGINVKKMLIEFGSLIKLSRMELISLSLLYNTANLCPFPVVVTVSNVAMNSWFNDCVQRLSSTA